MTNNLFASIEAIATRGMATPQQDLPQCEDRVYASEKLLMVMDGASSTSDTPRYNGKSAGLFAAESAIIGALAEDFENGDQATATSMMQRANQLINHGGRGTKMKYHLPIAAGAIVKLHENGTFTWAIAADCEIAVLYENGTVRLLRKGARGQKAEAARVAAALAEGKSGGDMSLDNPRLKEMHHRRVHSHNVNFPVLNGEVTFNDLIEDARFSGRESMKGVSGIVLMSDGAAWPALEGEEAYASAAQSIYDNGAQDYSEELVDLYEADKGYKRYPRRKHYDDIGIAIGVFDPIN